MTTAKKSYVLGVPVPTVRRPTMYAVVTCKKNGGVNWITGQRNECTFCHISWPEETPERAIDRAGSSAYEPGAILICIPGDDFQDEVTEVKSAEHVTAVVDPETVKSQGWFKSAVSAWSLHISKFISGKD